MNSQFSLLEGSGTETTGNPFRKVTSTFPGTENRSFL